MKFTTVTSRLILVALFAAAVCVRADETPTVTVKGYVLDSACIDRTKLRPAECVVSWGLICAISHSCL